MCFGYTCRADKGSGILTRRGIRDVIPARPVVSGGQQLLLVDDTQSRELAACGGHRDHRSGRTGPGCRVVREGQSTERRQSLHCTLDIEAVQPTWGRSWKELGGATAPCRRPAVRLDPFPPTLGVGGFKITMTPCSSRLLGALWADCTCTIHRAGPDDSLVGPPRLHAAIVRHAGCSQPLALAIETIWRDGTGWDEPDAVAHGPPRAAGQLSTIWPSQINGNSSDRETPKAVLSARKVCREKLGGTRTVVWARGPCRG